METATTDENNNKNINSNKTNSKVGSSLPHHKKTAASKKIMSSIKTNVANASGDVTAGTAGVHSSGTSTTTTTTASAGSNRRKTLSGQELKALFESLDTQNTGRLHRDDLRAICPDLADDELSMVFEELDLNGDGEIDYEDFCSGMVNVQKSLYGKKSPRMDERRRTRLTLISNWLPSNQEEADGHAAGHGVVDAAGAATHAQECAGAGQTGASSVTDSMMIVAPKPELQQGLTSLACQDKVYELYQTLATDCGHLSPKFEEMIGDLLKEISMITTDHKRLENCYIKEKEHFCKILKQSEEEYERQLNQLSDAIKKEESLKNQKDMMTLLAKKDQSIQQLTEKIQELSELQMAAANAKTDDETSLSEINDQVTKLAQDNRTMNHKLMMSQMEATMAQSEKITMQQELEEKTKEMEKFRLQMDELQRECAMILHHNQTITDMNTQLRDTNETLRTTIEYARGVSSAGSNVSIESGGSGCVTAQQQQQQGALIMAAIKRRASTLDQQIEACEGVRANETLPSNALNHAALTQPHQQCIAAEQQLAMREEQQVCAAEMLQEEADEQEEEEENYIKAGDSGMSTLREIAELESEVEQPTSIEFSANNANNSNSCEPVINDNHASNSARNSSTGFLMHVGQQHHQTQQQQQQNHHSSSTTMLHAVGAATAVSCLTYDSNTRLNNASATLTTQHQQQQFARPYSSAADQHHVIASGDIFHEHHQQQQQQFDNYKFADANDKLYDCNSSSSISGSYGIDDDAHNHNHNQHQQLQQQNQHRMQTEMRTRRHAASRFNSRHQQHQQQQRSPMAMAAMSSNSSGNRRHHAQQKLSHHQMAPHVTRGGGESAGGFDGGSVPNLYRATLMSKISQENLTFMSDKAKGYISSSEEHEAEEEEDEQQQSHSGEPDPHKAAALAALHHPPGYTRRRKIHALANANVNLIEHPNSNPNFIQIHQNILENEIQQSSMALTMMMEDDAKLESRQFANEQHQENHQLMTAPQSTNSVQPEIFPQQQQQQPERVYKVVLAGDSAVGKSSFLMRVCKNTFVSNTQATVGVDFQNKTIVVDNRVFVIQLWDTAGQERFQCMARNYFRKADGVLLLYDCTYERSFMNVRNWLETIKESSSEHVPVMIVANKIDLREKYSREGRHVILQEEGHRLARDSEALFIETSAKDGTNIADTLIYLARHLKSHEDMEVSRATLHFNKDFNETQKKKSPCC